jgi:hypothetical protein
MIFKLLFLIMLVIFPLQAFCDSYYVIGNYYVNEAIEKLQKAGYKIKSVQALSAPTGVLGCYDILITYE